MARLFRQCMTRYRLPDGKAVKKGTAGALKIKENSAKWYGEFTDALGILRRAPLANDKTAAQAMLAELLRKAERERAGYTDPFEAHRKRPLAEHLAAYTAHLAAKGNTTKHVSLSTGRIQAIVEACGFRRIGDVSANAVASHLAEARRTGEIGIATSNHRLAALKGFTRWLVRDRRTADDPLSYVSALNAKTDVRRERRPLDPAEFAALVEAARLGKPFRKLSGPDRALLYMLAANTGLRASELASLTAASFDLAGDPATVTVEAAYSKHRRRDVLPLRADLVVRLCPFVTTFDDKAPSVAQNRRKAKDDRKGRARRRRRGTTQRRALSVARHLG